VDIVSNLNSLKSKLESSKASLTRAEIALENIEKECQEKHNCHISEVDKIITKLEEELKELQTSYQTEHDSIAKEMETL
jgi:hypothetical protein